jgi:NAD(P)-dependent dehydrogenase (short-subunit alcohol dehydrogenase family)
VVVITVAASGLGREYAKLIASRGGRVVVNDTGGSTTGEGADESAAAAAVREIEDAGGTAVADTNDGSSVEGAQAMIKTALDTYGKLDAVIANAGILRDKSFHKMADEDFWKVVDVHLRGTVNVFKAAYPLMREQNYGRLVSTTSAAGLFGNFGQTNYSAAKMGIVGFTRTVAIEGAKYGINANVIAPMAATRLVGAMEGNEEIQARMKPEFVAPLGAYLAHSDTAVTGEIFSVGMGRLARVRIGVGIGSMTDVPTVEWVAEVMDDVLADDMFFPKFAPEELMTVFQASVAVSRKQ